MNIRSILCGAIASMMLLAGTAENSVAEAYQKISDGRITAYLLEDGDSEELPIAFQRQIIASARLAQYGDYNKDEYSVVLLHEGDLLYGMLGRQSNFYTDKDTYDKLMSQKHDGLAMNDVLQIKPFHGTLRSAMGVYRINRPMFVATGYCLNNPAYGAGGGRQYVLPIMLVQQQIYDRQGDEVNFSVPVE